MFHASMKQWVLAGVVVVASVVSGSADESTVYQFDDWKVTITPHNPRASTPDPISAKRKKDLPAIRPNQTIMADRARLKVQPVSLQQDASAAPAPAPAGEIVQASKIDEAPAPTPQPNPVPPAPQPSTVAADDLPVITPRACDLERETPVLPAQVQQYREIYAAIPYNHVEYLANPSYRHDATMEFIFNQMRPTVIQRGTTNVYHYDMNDGYGYGYGGYPFSRYYPFNYGLRIHSSR